MIVSLIPSPLMLGVLNARPIRMKGPLLPDIVTSHDLDFVCLTKTHVRLSDMDSFLQSITHSDLIFLQRSHPSGTGGGYFLIRSSYRPLKI